ncbi:MAG: xanthine dehydrogenase family protein molybdopterin-binding subunit [Frankiales bacterium]|nr:xanthine dehydrogenase family protein molybdopterin-binding subunit [Frankiales bacterium]
MTASGGGLPADFLDDVPFAGALHARIVQSRFAGGAFASVDDSACASVPGFVGTVTAADVTGLGLMGAIVHDRPVLASHPRFVGEPVALVVGETQLAADLAHARVRVRAEGPVSDLGPLHPRGPEYVVAPGWNLEPAWDQDVCHRARLTKGDPALACADAALVLEGTYTSPAIAQSPVEPHGAVASWRQGELFIWSNCQHPFAVREEVARIFGLPLSRVRIIVPRIGGGFGSKSWTKVEPLAAAAAVRFGRTVKLMLRSGDSALLTRRHPAVVRLRTSFATDGRILGREASIVLDTGAYTDNGPRVLNVALTGAVMPYSVPAFDVQATLAYSASVPSGAMRAIGSPQVQFASEQQLDEAARRLGLDPWHIRRLNLAGPQEMVIPGMRPADPCTAQLLAAVDEEWAMASAVSAHASGHADTRRGLGISVAMTPGGASPASTAFLKLAADGSVVVLAGTSEMGQGAHGTLAQLVARALGTAAEQVLVRTTDTGYTPYDYSTGASRSTTFMGTAVRAACDDAIEQARLLYARIVGCQVTEVTYVDGSVLAVGTGATLAEVVQEAFGPGGELVARGWSSRYGSPSASSIPSRPVFWELSAAIAHVELTTDDDWSVSRLTMVGTPGTVMNTVDGVRPQEEGAAIMGLGAALFEAMVEPDPADSYYSVRRHRLPLVRDLPAELRARAVEDGTGPGPDGQRGVGECGLVASMNAVLAACADARGEPVTRTPVGRTSDGAAHSPPLPDEESAWN